jgi:hypothetical protein
MRMNRRTPSIAILAGLFGAVAMDAGCVFQTLPAPVSVQLANDSTFVVDPNLNVGGVLQTDLGGVGSPFPVLLSGETVSLSVDCSPGLRLTVQNPEFTLPAALGGGRAESVEVIEGVDFICGSTIQFRYSQISSDQFAVTVELGQ